ncbi:MAG: ferritin-like domain-containing protein [Acidimicrobiia bacterium]|nr:ferritin-like domain-containing protein [Acidimicrobiia bacterium]
MELNQDEVRRQAFDTREDHRSAMRRWKDALSRAFDRERPSGLSDEAKASALSVPTRRQVFRIGGMSVAGAAVLAGLRGRRGRLGGYDDRRRPRRRVDDDHRGASGDETDVTLLRTAQSIEVLAIDAYQTAIESGLVTTTAIADAAMLFQEQHRDHAGAIEALTVQNGGEPFTEANPFLQENVVDPALAEVSDENGVVVLAADLENAAAQTYALAAGALTTTELRRAIMTIGGVEARHLAVLNGVLEGAGTPQVPTVFMQTTDAAPEESYV